MLGVMEGTGLHGIHLFLGLIVLWMEKRLEVIPWGSLRRREKTLGHSWNYWEALLSVDEPFSLYSDHKVVTL